MSGFSRAAATVSAAAASGFLLWIATQFSNDHVGGYWVRIGLLAGAGFVMGLSQLLGGWTNQGFPRLSVPVLLLAFLPVAVVSLCVILAGEPGAGWFHNHALSWTHDIHVSGLVADMVLYIPVLSFGTGLVLGYSFDTTGPRVLDRKSRHDDDASPAVDRDSADAPPTADRETTVDTRDSEAVATTTTSDSRTGEGALEIHERIAAYTLSYAQDQPQAERRSDRDRRSGIDRRQAPVERFERSSDRRVGGERRSGMSRRRTPRDR